MGHFEKFVSLSLLCAIILGGCSANDDMMAGVPNPLIRKVGSDRSVYARRSFALPDVNSDVYEVYVGPSDVSENSKTQAVVILQGQSGVQGLVTFAQEHPNEPVIIEGSISGLAPGLHGFHIHEKGDLRNGCASTGSHFNPFNQPHGAPTDRIRHVGDLGNILADASGVATFRFSDKVISLSGINSILGRACLVHQKEDDLGRGDNDDSKKTGNAGARLACGLIGIA